MSQEKDKLQNAMQRIKAILQEEDIAATVVLTTPNLQGTADDFVTVK